MQTQLIRKPTTLNFTSLLKYNIFLIRIQKKEIKKQLFSTQLSNRFNNVDSKLMKNKNTLVDVNSYHILEQKPEPEFFDESIRMKQDVSFQQIYLRDLKHFSCNQLRMVLKQIPNETPAKLELQYYIFKNLFNGEILTKCLSETLSETHSFPISREARKKLIEKLPQHDFLKDNILDLMLETFSYWNYQEWDKNLLTSVLRLHFNEQIDGIEELEIDGKYIDRLVTVYSDYFHSREEVIKSDFPEYEKYPSQFKLILQWIEKYLIIRFNQRDLLEIEPFLQQLKQEGTLKPIEPCEPQYVYQDSTDFLHTDAIYYLDTKLKGYSIKSPHNGTVLIVEGDEGSGKSRFLKEIAGIFQTRSIDKNFSEKYKVIDIRIELNNKLDPNEKQLRNLDCYLLARIIHYYVNYIRPFKWPGTDDMTDSQFIEKVMNDLENYSSLNYYIKRWIKETEAKYSEGKEIWMHYSFDNFIVLLKDPDMISIVKHSMNRFYGDDSTCCSFWYWIGLL